MRTTFRCKGALAAVVVALVCVAPGAALGKRKPRLNQEAKRLYEHGKREYVNKRWTDALSAFKAAYEADPQPRFLFNIGRCHERLEQYPEAIEYVLRYLGEAEEDADLKDAEDLVAMLRNKLSSTRGQVQVRSHPAEARVRIYGHDEEFQGKTPFEAWVPFGRWQFVVSREGYLRERGSLVVERDKPVEVELALRRAVKDSGPALPLGPLATLGGAAVLAVAGGVFGVLTMQAEETRDDLKGTPTPLDDLLAKDDEVQSRASTTNVLLGAAAVAAAAGGVWFVLARGSGPAERAAFEVAPAPGGLTFTWGGGP